MRANENGERVVDAESAKWYFARALKALGFDWVNDPNMSDTPARWVRMMTEEVCRGCYSPPPKITSFPKEAHADQFYVVGPMSVRSLCSHHMLPIIGQAWVCVWPGDRLVGLSKFARLCDWVMRRPQIQEEATAQLADAIEQHCAPNAVAVLVDAEHLCMTYRGVLHERSRMVTSVMRGEFLTNAAAKSEALRLMGQAGAPNGRS